MGHFFGFGFGFENTYFQVFLGFPAVKETVAHIQPNGQFWKNFGQNGQNGNFFQKSARNIFFAITSLTAKFQKKVMKGFREKCEKPPMGKTGIFSKKRLEHFSHTYKP